MFRLLRLKPQQDKWISGWDPSGAMIPGAAVTISGTDTGNVARTLKTNEVGVASAPSSGLRSYPFITVNVQGFKELIRRGESFSG